MSVSTVLWRTLVTKSGAKQYGEPTVQKVGPDPHGPLEVYAYGYF